MHPAEHYSCCSDAKTQVYILLATYGILVHIAFGFLHCDLARRTSVVSDPSQQDDEEYIVRLVGTVTTVSTQTVRLLGEMLRRDASLG